MNDYSPSRRRARSIVALQNSVHIARPVAEVFAYLVNPADWSSWDATVKKATPSELPLRAGTMIRTQGQFFLGRTRDMERRVIVYEPGTRFVTESIKPFPLTITWTFAPENAGTRVVREGEARASAIASLLVLVVQRMAWRTQQASLERMKTLLEARRSDAPT